MRHLPAALLFAALPATSLAQQMPIQITPNGPNGVNVQFGPDNQGDEAETATHSYKFVSGPIGRAVIDVKSPEGAKCTVYDGQRAVGVDTVPFPVMAEPDVYYRFVCQLPGGGTFDKKFPARRHARAVLNIKAPTGGADLPPPAPAPAPVKPVEPAGPTAMSDEAFSRLVAAVKNESFEDNRLNVISLAAGRNHFTIKQVGKLVDSMSFSAGKVKVVSVTNKRIVDPENAADLLKHFTFSGDKDKVRDLLSK